MFRSGTPFSLPLSSFDHELVRAAVLAFPANDDIERVSIRASPEGIYLGFCCRVPDSPTARRNVRRTCQALIAEHGDLIGCETPVLRHD